MFNVPNSNYERWLVDRSDFSVLYLLFLIFFALLSLGSGQYLILASFVRPIMCTVKSHAIKVPGSLFVASKVSATLFRLNRRFPNLEPCVYLGPTTKLYN
jgi:hypothetical protein